MNDSLTPRWVTNIIHTCMGLQNGEKVLIAVDEPLSRTRDALIAEAIKTQPAELWSYTFPNASRPFNEYPNSLLTLFTQVDVIVLLLASMDASKELPAWSAGKAVALSGPARAGWGAFIEQSILDYEMSADYEQIAEFSLLLAEQVRGSSHAHITTSLGTNLHMSLAGREWKVDIGKLRGRGGYGNLPAGEIYIAPNEDSAEGVLVIDKSFPGLLLSDPVKLFFERGHVTQIEGDEGKRYLENAFTQHGDTARVIAELGIGTNPMARLQGNIMTDEKVLGTIHVAVGRNDFIGGRNIATTHIDGVISQPTLEIDGKVLINNGKHTLQAAG
jgi:leucyl aminopeptidase (aminopeptidase T)